MNRRGRVVAAAALGAVLAVVSTGCGAPRGITDIPFGTGTSPATSGVDAVTWMLSTEPGTLDVDIEGGQTEDTVMSNVCERLMQLQPDLTTKPHLAQSVERPDPTTVVFNLRTDVTFHDGSAMTAQDVVWSMQRHSAEGADEADEYENVASVDATGTYQVTVRLTRADAIFLQAMAGDGGIVWNRKVIDAQGEAFGGPGSPDACSGPFTIETWIPGDSLTLARAPRYWDAGRAALSDRITFRWADSTAVANSIVSGESDGAYLLDPSGAAAFAGNSAVRLAQGPATNAWSLIVTDRGPLRDVRLRRALSLAMPRTGIALAAFSGLAEPWKTPLGPGAWGYERARFEAAYQQLAGAPDRPQEADLNQARALVQDAGAPGEELVIASGGSAARNVIANAFVDAAGKIGLRARILTFSPQQYNDFYTDETLRAQVDAFADEYYISKNDPIGFYGAGVTDDSNNFLGISDPEYDDLMRQAFAAADDTQRVELAIRIQEKWTDRMPWIPLVSTPATLAMNSALTGPVTSAAFLYYPWAALIGKAQ